MHHAAHDVGGHQVGSELYARILQMQHASQRAQQRGLAQSRDAFQQNVSAREQTNQDAIHHILLADDDLGDFLSDLIQLRGGKLEGGIGGHYLILDAL